MPEARDERLAAHLEVPDGLADVPTRYLSAAGFGLRLLRLIARDERVGVTPADTLEAVRLRCEDVAVTLWPSLEDEEEEAGDGDD